MRGPNGMVAFWGLLLVGDMLTRIKQKHRVKSQGKCSQHLLRGGGEKSEYAYYTCRS